MFPRAYFAAVYFPAAYYPSFASVRVWVTGPVATQTLHAITASAAGYAGSTTTVASASGASAGASLVSSTTTVASASDATTAGAGTTDRP